MKEENKKILMAEIQRIQKQIELVEKEKKQMNQSDAKTIMELYLTMLKNIESLELTLWKILQ